ncbi:hypothetical protein RJ640_019724, partial [Escallonia rubra]
MSFKRSPIGKSSGSGETNLRRRVSPPPPPSAVGNTDDPSRPRIMTVSSPEQERSEVVGEGGFGRFLEKCHYCNKRIQKNAEVFMYRSPWTKRRRRGLQVAMGATTPKARL